MESIKAAEKQLNTTMKTPTAFKEHPWSPIKYDVEADLVQIEPIKNITQPSMFVKKAVVKANAPVAATPNATGQAFTIQRHHAKAIHHNPVVNTTTQAQAQKVIEAKNVSNATATVAQTHNQTNATAVVAQTHNQTNATALSSKKQQSKPLKAIHIRQNSPAQNETRPAQTLAAP
jgi:hypothetical protein